MATSRHFEIYKNRITYNSEPWSDSRQIGHGASAGHRSDSGMVKNDFFFKSKMAADDKVNFTIKKLNYIITVRPKFTKFGREIQLATAQKN